MTIRYSCDKCGKDFNFRIKLNRHIALVHGDGAQDVNNDAKLLKEDMSDQEKLACFDLLQKKVFDLLDKHANWANKVTHLQEQLTLLEKGKFKRKYKIKKKKKHKVEVEKSFKGIESYAGEYEIIEHDDSIPKGWRSANKKVQGFTKEGTLMRLFWAPNGRYCASRRSALHYMVHELGSSEEDIHLTRSGLEAEGWYEDKDDLPEGWLCKYECERPYFLSPSYKLCKGFRAAMKIMLNSSVPSEKIGNFVCKYVFTRGTFDPAGIFWIKDQRVPSSWRLASTSRKGRKKIIISPTGHVFSGSKAAKEIINKSLDLSTKEKIDFFNILGIGCRKARLSSKEKVKFRPKFEKLIIFL